MKDKNDNDGMIIRSIGKIKTDGKSMIISLDRKYKDALIGLDEFSHIIVIWWFTETDNPFSRSKIIEDEPYMNGPKEIGIFATRSPERPNPIAISVSGILKIDHEKGIIFLDYIDALPGTPILDIKPYTPSTDRIESPKVPNWCSDWPISYEESGNFDWSQIFNF